MRFTILPLFVALSLPVAVSADIVAAYDFTGNTGAEAFEIWSYVAPNALASNLTRGPGLFATANPDSFAAKNWMGPEGTDYFSFSIAPETGYKIDLTSIDLGVMFQDLPHESTAFQLHSSLDGFASILGSVPVTFPATSQQISFGTPLSILSQVEFRLVAHINSDNGKFAALTNQNGTPGLVLNGLVSPASVPEPGSIVLLTLTGLATVGVRTVRKRRSKNLQAAA
ncbi:MAG: PEP-CTERM sorting domain-containing protein [Planctomycetaceae bacterium]